MRVIQTQVYLFDELSDKAKTKARQWAHSLDLFGQSDDHRTSVQAFCEHFGVTLSEWSCGPWCPYLFKTTADNSHFRGVKLKDINPEYMPTGYYLDCTLWGTFYNGFKFHGNALGAFNLALSEGFRKWRSDWESAYSDESIDEFLSDNNYEFTEEGERVIKIN